MAKLGLPPILTEADWTKQKGKFAKLAGPTGVSELLKIIASQHRAVQWGRLDITQALKSGASAKATEAALKAAKQEYASNVLRLHKRVAELPKVARLAEAKYRKLGLADAASHAVKVAKAAELFAAQVLRVQDELKAFEQANAKAQAEAERLAKEKEDEAREEELESREDSGDKRDQKVLVRDVLGARWFTELEKIKFFRSDQIKQWIASDELALSARDGKPAANLKSAQNAAKEASEKFQQAYARLRALRDKALERPAAIKQATELWRQARAAYAEPGIVQAHHDWEVLQKQQAGTSERLAAWEKKYAAAAELHKRVGKMLQDDGRLILALDNHLDKVK
jgi:hypothetical protein